jgi:hypothetical protein
VVSEERATLSLATGEPHTKTLIDQSQAVCDVGHRSDTRLSGMTLAHECENLPELGLSRAADVEHPSQDISERLGAFVR